MTVFNKEQLKVFFEPNQNQNVRLWDLQNFVDSNNVMKIQVEAGGPVATTALDDAILALPGATTIVLPDIVDSGPKTMIIFNTAGVTLSILPNGGDTINGNASDSLLDENFVFYFPVPGANDWITLVNTGSISLGFGVGYFEDDLSTTVINAQGVYEVINGTYIADNSTNYVIGPQSITYIGQFPRLCAVDINVSGKKDNLGALEDQFSVAMFRNGAKGSPKLSQSFNKQTDRECSLSSIVLVEQNDVLDVRMANDDGTSDVIIRDMQFRLVEIANG